MTNPSGNEVCFVAEHQYDDNARGDHMIRVVSPQGVYAECVGTPGAELVLRTPTDRARSAQGGTSGEQLPGQESAQGSTNTGTAQSGRASGGSEHAEASGNTQEQRDSSSTAGSQDQPLKIRPDTEVGLRAIVVFPSGKEDDERDVTARTEFTSSKPDVVAVNNTTGSNRGQIQARTNGKATITGRYSGMTAKRKVIVVDKTATAVRIASATGNTDVNVGEILPLRATVTYDSGQSEQVTEDITWSSSDQSIADVDSGGEVEGVASGSATITGTYTNKDGTKLEDDIDITVTDTGGSGDQGSGGDSSQSPGADGGNSSGSDSGDTAPGSDSGSSNGAGQGSSGDGSSQTDSQENA